MNWKYIISAEIILIASAYISFMPPFSISEIPFTAQSLAVFLIAALLNSKDFSVCLILYLCLGICGLPIFAGGSSGLSQITGASGGFLYGFLFAGLYISSRIKALHKKTLLNISIVFLIATIILFLFGLVHLSIIYNWSGAIEYGFIPFWKMALIKALIASLIYYLLSSHNSVNTA